MVRSQFLVVVIFILLRSAFCTLAYSGATNHERKKYILPEQN